MYLDFSKKLNKVLDGVTKCLIIPHKNPDADALGSSVALSSFLIKTGEKHKGDYTKFSPRYLNWMVMNHDIVSYENSPEKLKITCLSMKLFLLWTLIP